MDSRWCTAFALCILAFALLSSAANASPGQAGVFQASEPLPGGAAWPGAVLLTDGSALIKGSFRRTFRFHPESGGFTEMAPTVFSHNYTTPALLPDGRVLLASGIDDGWTGNAEIYAPTTNTWVPTGSMVVPRRYPLVLTDHHGRVFFLGGQTQTQQAVTSVERYDPATGSFVPAGNLAVARRQTAGIVLADGRFLIVGGVGSDSRATATAEVFDPNTGIATPTFPPNDARYKHVVVALQDGRVLISGGTVVFLSSIQMSRNTELFDPTTRRFTTAPLMTVPRGGHTATRLASGEVLLVGGVDDYNSCYQTTELFDPTAPASGPAFRPGPLMTSPHCYHTSIPLRDGSSLLAGGSFYSQGFNFAVDRFYPDAVFADGFQ